MERGRCWRGGAWRSSWASIRLLLATAAAAFLLLTAGGPLAAEASAFELVRSSSSTRSSPSPLQGATLAGNMYVFVSPEAGATRVRFWLDDPSRTGRPKKTENFAPWDFAGTGSAGGQPANAFDSRLLAEGQHTITAVVDKTAGGSDTVSGTFTVQNSPPPPPPPSGCTPSPCPDSSRVSFSANRANSTPLQGQTVGGDIYVFAQSPGSVSSVRFFLDDTTMTGAPLRTESGAPYDLGGTASDGTARPFSTLRIANGPHTLTIAVDRGTHTNVVHATFTVDNGTPICTPVPCADVLVDLPYTLDFAADDGGVKDTNNIGTGFTWIDRPTNATGYIPANLEQSDGTLKITTTSGLQYTGVNSLDNALAVGIDAPSQVTKIKTTVVDPPTGSGAFQQAGVWFGNDERSYVKLIVISSSTGLKVQYFHEENDVELGSIFTGVVNTAGSNIELSLLANPADRTITAKYKLGGVESTVGVFTVSGEMFSFDAAGINPEIGTRSFGGIFASHRNGTSPLTYTFEDFSVTREAAPPPAGGLAFARSSFPVNLPTSMAWGPDNRLYVSELFGDIHRISFDANGQVSGDQEITTLGNRLTLGLTVDPVSTASDVVLWASHSSPSTNNGVPNSGIVSRLSGPNLGTREDVITGLPRAIANHGTNSLHFGPDGKLYIAQGGNTGAGAPNNANTEFGTMSEQPLSAALLVADVRSGTFDGSCNNASDIFGPPPCDVTTYATGTRNMYDFVFHSNGKIYGPDNGLGVAGTFPPSPTPPCTGFGDPAPWNQGGHNPGSQPDPLLLLEQGKYYGHPNPRRNQCVFKDGSYQGVSAPANYKPPIYNLGNNRSADGTIEYDGDSFCGELDGELLIANYSVGDDISRVRLSSDGLSVTSVTSLVGDFNDPLPLTQAPDGRIFVGEMGAGQVTVLTPTDTGCWTAKAPLPAQVLDAGGAALGGKLYVVGGKTAVSHRSTVNVYDPGADAWSLAADLPGPAVENPAVVALAGKLYVFGGSTAPFSGAVGNAAVYNPGTNSWTALPAMPTARGGVAAAAIGSKIYLVGGMGANGASLDTVEVFDTTNNQWSTAAPLATRRDNPGAAAVNGKVYVFGGRTRNADGTTPNGTLATVEAYDPSTNSWSPKAAMPTGRRTMAVGTLNGRVQLMGGEITLTGGAFAENEEYDPASDSWRALKSMSTPRHGAAAGTIGDVVYVAGGGPQGGFTLSNVNEAFAFVP